MLKHKHTIILIVKDIVMLLRAYRTDLKIPDIITATNNIDEEVTQNEEISTISWEDEE